MARARYARRAGVSGGTVDARLQNIYATHFGDTPETGWCDTLEDWLARGAPVLLDTSDEEAAVLAEFRASLPPKPIDADANAWTVPPHLRTASQVKAIRAERASALKVAARNSKAAKAAHSTRAAVEAD